MERQIANLESCILQPETCNLKLRKEIKMKVLIVDDYAILRKKLKEMISEIEGIDIISEAKNPLEAMRSIKTINPDVVILDIRLNRESGIDLLEKIKKSRPDTKVIMFTNYPYPQYRKKCKELGADFFFGSSPKSVHEN